MSVGLLVGTQAASNAQNASAGAPWWSLALTAVVALLVGWFGRQATLGSAKIAAGVEEKKLQHERDKYFDERRDKAGLDVAKASDAMGIVAKTDVAFSVRQAHAREARAALLSVGWTLNRVVGGPRLGDLLKALDSAQEPDLAKAAELWPDIEQAIRRDDPTRPR